MTPSEPPVGPVCEDCGEVHLAGVACGDPCDPRLGSLLADKYRLVRLVGRGGMGSVYEARHAALDRRFAVKFLRPEYAAQQALIHRCENEAKAAARLEHANVAAVVDFGCAPDGARYLVMEFLQGMDCAQVLARAGPLPLSRAANIVFQACCGLEAAHRSGIVHRDIKPENLFVADAGDGTDLVKVLDFGIAKLRASTSSAATGVGVQMGTCYYMSPEQVRSAGEVDERTDVWALGVVLHELLSGRKPFSGSEPMHIFYQILEDTPEPLDILRPDLPREMVTVISRAMEKTVEGRLASVGALAHVLSPFTGRPSAAPLRNEDALHPTLASTNSAGPEPLPPASTSHIAAAAITRVPDAGVASHRRRMLLAGAGALLVALVSAVGILSVRRSAQSTFPPGIRDPAGQGVESGAATAARAPEAQAMPGQGPSVTPAPVETGRASGHQQGVPGSAGAANELPADFGARRGLSEQVRNRSNTGQPSSQPGVDTARPGETTPDAGTARHAAPHEQTTLSASAAPSAQPAPASAHHPIAIDTANPF